MTNSVLAETITRTKVGLIRHVLNTRGFCATKQNRINFPAIREAILLGNQEGRT